MVRKRTSKKANNIVIDSNKDTDIVSCDPVKDEPASTMNRLSGLKKPKVGKVIQEAVIKKTAKTRRDRNTGKLAQLMTMPLDVFFEITSKLEPIDILQLARVSKHFRSVFLSATSKHIWVAARRNVPGLPDCPRDLNEAQYACLLFERNCHACGSPRAQKVDYSLRVRFCGPCYKQNVQKGSTLLRCSQWKWPDVVYTLVPRSMLALGRRYRFVPFPKDSLNNTKFNAYYGVELEMVAGRYQLYQSNAARLQHFVKEQQTAASQMMESASILDQWEQSCRVDKLEEVKEHIVNRKASIEKKLLELGWDQRFFPGPYDWNSEWDRLTRQPRELSDRIWNNIRPKLEEILIKRKEDVLLREFKTRFQLRCDELAEFYDEFLAQLPPGEGRDAMPNIADASKLPTLAKFLSEEEARLQVTTERWESVVDSVLPEAEVYKLRIKRELLGLLNGVETPPESQEASTEDTDFHALYRASSLFTCRRCRELIGFPAILTHRHEGTAHKPWNTAQLKCDPMASEIALLTLKALDLPEDMSTKAVGNLSERFMCLCGRPDFRKSVSFLTLVNHIVEENQWYTDVAQSPVSDTADVDDITLHNDHDLANSDPCVALLAPEDLPVEIETESNPFPYGSRPCCRLCAAARHRFQIFATTELAEHHMKAKHLRDANEDDIIAISEVNGIIYEHRYF